MPKSNPYHVHLNDATYSFSTEYGLHYACDFYDITPLLPPVVGIYDIQVLDFEFTASGKQKHDPRVGDTIRELIRQTFDDNKRAVLFMCDNSDSKGKARHKTFQKWSDDPMIKREDWELQAGDQVVLGSILTRKDFPYPDVLQREVINPVKDFAVQKFGE